MSKYDRQVRCAVWKEAGQSRFREGRAVVVGVGALGTVAAEMLVRAGIGGLTLIDRDFVEAGNLHRQMLYSEADGRDALPKAVAAERRLRAINSDVEIRAFVDDLDSRNAAELLPADIILDATDNFETRFLINDYAVSTGTPWIYSAAVGTYGLTMSILPGETACLRCVYPDPPSSAQPTCETEGVLAPATSLIATIAAAEAMKLLSGNREALRRTILNADIWTGRIRESTPPARDPDCPACARGEFPWLSGDRRAPVSLCGQNAVQIHERKAVDLPVLQRQLSPLGPVRANEFALRFFREPFELTVFPDGRAIIKGTTDPAVARSVYARYVGN